ncbi:FHA domain-containing protein [Cnuibacter physcomitrellae]|uniref:FHA domain-containing protein n=1 Tax=Cnuibacter physcomitrellae TaxID=1619308 RepID=UPI002175FE2E|nr:FHA domain-containing protein [Cnuibacter physcomitrellae]MCS5498143.1 FHA domain-containing protein [Cnuibacter physcomitrellae]
MSAPEIRYRPGTLRAVVSPLGVAVLPDTIDAVLLDRIWRDLESGLGLEAVLESLTGAFGTSLRLIPPFAVIALDGSGTDARVAVRGELSIEAIEATGSEPVTVSGADVTTWSERVLRAPRSLEVRSAQTAAPEELGIASGIVLAGALTLSFTPTPASSAAPTAQNAQHPHEDRAETEHSTPSTAHPAPSSAQNAQHPHEDGAETEHSAPTPALPATPPPPPSAQDAQLAPAVGAESEHSTPSPALPATPPAPASAQNAQHSREDGAESERSEPEAHPEETISAPEETLAAAPEGAPAEALEPSSAQDVRRPDEGGAEGEQSAEDEAQGGEVPEATVGELPDDAYDHLWGATVVKSVETAAVREVEEDDESPEPAAEPVVAPAPEPAAPAPAPAPEPSAWTAPPATGLIDSVPGFGTIGTPAPAPSTPAPAAPAAPEQRRPLAAPPAYTAEPTASAPATSPADDHDGLTVTVSELEAMRRLSAASDGAGTGAGQSTADSGEEPVALGRIVLSTGETHVLDRPVIIGRRPRANRVQGDRMPLLIAVDSPEQDISRNHLEVRLEGRHVLVADMRTTNGSVLHREGTPPLRLSPDEAVLVLSDDLVDLGDGVTVRFEEIP